VHFHPFQKCLYSKVLLEHLFFRPMSVVFYLLSIHINLKTSLNFVLCTNSKLQYMVEHEPKMDEHEYDWFSPEMLISQLKFLETVHFYTTVWLRSKQLIYSSFYSHNKHCWRCVDQYIKDPEDLGRLSDTCPAFSNMFHTRKVNEGLIANTKFAHILFRN